MAIVAVLSGLGALGLNTFRQTSIIQQATSQFISDLRTLQNAARNSIVSQKLFLSNNNVLLSTVDGYALYIETNGNYSIRYCKTQQLAGVTQYDCSGVEVANIKNPIYNEIRVVPTNSSKCRAILFVRGSTDISALSSSVATPDNTGSCTIDVNIPNSGNDDRPVIIDLAKNNIQT